MSAQTIFRNACADKPFTAILNSAIQDTELTAEAGWVLVFMLSQSKEWGLNLKHVASSRRMGRDRAQKAVTELIARGYCKRIQVRKKDGRMSAYEYWFTDKPGAFSSPKPDLQAPEVKPEPEQPAPEQPEPDLQAAYKVKTVESNEGKNTPIVPKGTDDDFGFEDFWEAYPEGCRAHTKKTAARAAFQAIVAGKHREGHTATPKQIVDGAKLYTASKPDPDFVPMALTWLNQARWLDKPGKRGDSNRTVRKICATDFGPTVHNTEGGREGFLAYRERMIREGKFNPNKVPA